MFPYVVDIPDILSSVEDMGCNNKAQIMKTDFYFFPVLFQVIQKTFWADLALYPASKSLL